jgi:hypothetical protein
MVQSSMGPCSPAKTDLKGRGVSLFLFVWLILQIPREGAGGDRNRKYSGDVEGIKMLMDKNKMEGAIYLQKIRLSILFIIYLKQPQITLQFIIRGFELIHINTPNLTFRSEHIDHLPTSFKCLDTSLDNQAA